MKTVLLLVISWLIPGSGYFLLRRTSPVEQPASRQRTDLEHPSGSPQATGMGLTPLDSKYLTGQAGKPQRHMGIIIFSLLGLLILIGLFLTDFRDVRFVDNPFYYAGRFGSGLTWLVTILLLSPSPAGIISYQYFDIGHLYLCVAGALNVVVLLNILAMAYKVTPVTTDAISELSREKTLQDPKADAEADYERRGEAS